MNSNNAIEIRIWLDEKRNDRTQVIPACHEIKVVASSSVNALLEVKTDENDFLPLSNQDGLVWTQKFSQVRLTNSFQEGEYLDILCINYGNNPPEKFKYNKAEKTIVEGITMPVTVRSGTGYDVKQHSLTAGVQDIDLTGNNANSVVISANVAFDIVGKDGTSKLPVKANQERELGGAYVLKVDASANGTLTVWEEF